MVRPVANVGNSALAADLCTCAHNNVLSKDAALDHGTCLDHDTVHQHGVLNGSALFHNNACAQHRVLDAAVDLAASVTSESCTTARGPIFWAGSTGLRL